MRTLENQFDLALLIASTMHADQKDKAGLPFILHILRVAMQFSPVVDLQAMIVGLLHDVVEDTSITLENLEEEFDPEIVAAVDALTRRHKESYWDYIDRLIASGSDLALRVKRADLGDNLDPARQNFPGAGSLAFRHREALNRVTAALVQYGPERIPTPLTA